jgi:hypothetical protein
MAAFQTLLGLGSGHKPTPYSQIRGAADLSINVDTAVAARHAARVMLSAVVGVSVQALLLLFLFFLLLAFFRNQRIAAAAFTILTVFVFPKPVNHALIGTALNAIGAAFVIFITIRFGLLAVMGRRSATV